MKKLLLISALLTNSAGYAGLSALDNEALQQVQGQGGADLSLSLSLNHGSNADGSSTNTLSQFCVTNYEQCRLAFSFNNRYDNGDYIDRVTGKAYKKDGTPYGAGTDLGTPTGNKLWLVFKKIQGTIDLQKVKLDGADLVYQQKNGAAGALIVKPTIQLTYIDTLPILIRNFGFEALSIETDSGTTPGYWLGSARSGYSDGSPATSSYTGGSGAGAFVDGKYTNTTNKFDLGREIGFTGMNMNGNLSISGTMKVFACDGSHPRC